jgi:hypothetical protein
VHRPHLGGGRSFGANVTVVDIPEPSKAAALRHGDQTGFVIPRLYVEADVGIDRGSVNLLVRALDSGTSLAAGPRRILPKTGVSRLVGCYYDRWDNCASARRPVCRGVIAVTAEGFQRVQDLPQLMSDDLIISEAFAPAELHDSCGSWQRALT